MSSVRRQNDDGRGPVLRLLRRPDLREMCGFTWICISYPSGSARCAAKGVEGPSRDSSTEAHAVVCRRRAKKGDARAHFSLAAMEAVLSEEEQARHLLLLVDESGFAEAIAASTSRRRRGSACRPSARPASTTASCPTDCAGGSWRSNGATRKRH